MSSQTQSPPNSQEEHSRGALTLTILFVALILVWLFIFFTFLARG